MNPVTQKFGHPRPVRNKPLKPIAFGVSLAPMSGNSIVQFIRTTKATGWKKANPRIPERIIELFLSIVPNANPGYESKFHLVHEWLIEFDDKGLPNREIGINKNGEPIIAGPSERNYGFWLDINMKISDFNDTPLAECEFETVWKEAVEKLLL